VDKVPGTPSPRITFVCIRIIGRPIGKLTDSRMDREPIYLRVRIVIGHTVDKVQKLLSLC
jgi:hypothetical protein